MLHMQQVVPAALATMVAFTRRYWRVLTFEGERPADKGHQSAGLLGHHQAGRRDGQRRREDPLLSRQGEGRFAYGRDNVQFGRVGEHGTGGVGGTGDEKPQ